MDADAMPTNFVSGALLALIFAASPEPNTAIAPIKRVDVFVADKAPIAAGMEAQALAAAGQLELWNLDDMERFNQRLSASLPMDRQLSPEAAAQLVAERANALTPEERALMARAANATVRADSFKVERLPAVVINESRVYYGSRTIEDALRAYRSGR
jgi:integrating conjugative element protein (TIGR03757 family)